MRINLWFHICLRKNWNHVFPSFSSRPFPTSWMDKNLVIHKKKSGNNVVFHLYLTVNKLIVEYQNQSKCSQEHESNSSNHTKRFLGRSVSISRKELIWLTHIWHVSKSLWPKMYTTGDQREGWVFDFWMLRTENRYICYNICNRFCQMLWFEWEKNDISLSWEKQKRNLYKPQINDPRDILQHLQEHAHAWYPSQSIQQHICQNS